MNPLLEAVIGNGLMFDLAGVVGLGLIGLAAAKLARRHHSPGGIAMACGAIALLVARLYILLSPQFMSDDFLAAIGPVGISATIALPPIFLTGGLAAVVWGLWAHERASRPHPARPRRG